MSEDFFGRQRWEREILEPTLRRHPERRERFETYSGIDIERVYTPREAEIDYVEDSGFPGQYPFRYKFLIHPVPCTGSA